MYKITATPKFGVILKDDVPVLSFSAQDLQEECIEYRHNNRYSLWNLVMPKHFFRIILPSFVFEGCEGTQMFNLLPTFQRET